jgi:DNA-binding CsgD family transcriptional regulator
MASDYMGDLLSCCVSSSATSKLLLKEGDKYFYTRSQLHALVISPFGTRKTTDVIAIPNSYNLQSFTNPSILGSITKTGEFVEGAIAKAAGKNFIVDEFQLLPFQSRMAMLNLLEHQTYTRSLGFKIQKPVNMNKKFCKIHASGNQWKMDVIFSCICSGTFIPKRRIDDYAWKSRFTVIQYNVDLADIYEMVSGKTVRKITPHEYKFVPVFEDYLKFVKEHERVTRSLPFVKNMEITKLGYIARNVIDMARLAAFFSGIKGEAVVTDWERVLAYIPQSLYNYVASSLTLTEYEILNKTLEGLSLQETAEQCKTSREYVVEVRNKLKREGLIKDI